MGTPEFSVATLESLVKSKYDIVVATESPWEISMDFFLILFFTWVLASKIYVLEKKWMNKHF